MWHRFLKLLSRLIPWVSIPAGKSTTLTDVAGNFPVQEMRPDTERLPCYRLRRNGGHFVMVGTVRGKDGETAYRLKNPDNKSETVVNRKLFELIFEKETNHE